MYAGLAEQLDPFGELCVHNAYGDASAAEAILTVPVGDVPAIAYASPESSQSHARARLSGSGRWPAGRFSCSIAV